MTQQDDSADKSFEATPQKLSEARKKGEIARSTDLFVAASYLGLLVSLAAGGSYVVQRSGNALIYLIDKPAALAAATLTGPARPLLRPIISDTLLGLLPLFLLPALCVMGAIFAQRALTFAPSKLNPKLSRISPLSNAKNKFGRSGLFEFAKSFAKLTIYSLFLALFIYLRLPDMIAALQTGPRSVLILLAQLCLAFLFVVFLISAVIGGVDAVWQHFEHLRKNRMSRKEVTEETKNQEGDPHLKQERRQRAVALSQNQMMAKVPQADVVIVNPTHYAVALEWSRKPGSAPICIAKGVDDTAQAIRKAAQEAGVPIHSDPPTARVLHATTDLGAEIAPDLYRAVAAAIRFAEQMRMKARASL